MLNYDSKATINNAYGTVARLSELKNGKPCSKEKLVISKENAIKKAKVEDAKLNGAGNAFNSWSIFINCLWYSIIGVLCYFLNHSKNF